MSQERAVAIIVPYMDSDPAQNRAFHLRQFLTYMPVYLARHGVPYQIYIMEQAGNEKFNRGALLNAGLVEAKKRNAYTRFIFHDADLLPCERLAVQYARTDAEGPIVHLGARWTSRYTGPAYMGGVISFTASDFEKVNGFP